MPKSSNLDPKRLEILQRLLQAIRSGEISRREFFRALSAAGLSGIATGLSPLDANAWQAWVGFWQNAQNNPAATYTGPDPYWDSVSLLMQFDGGSGSAIFADESHVGKNPTLVGSPYIDTSAGSSPYTGCTGSGKFNGSTDYVSFPDGLDWDFGSGDFTLELRFKLAVTNTDQAFAAHYKGGAGYRGWRWLWSGTTSKFIFYWSPDGSSTPHMDVSWTPDTNWHHLALARSGNSLTLFLDGTQVGTMGITDTIFYGISYPLEVGASAAGTLFNGSLADLRIYKGAAKYTANFTPPSAPIGLSSYNDPYWAYCVLACPFENTLKDCSGKRPTNTGSPQISGTQKKFGSGALTLNGSTDYLALPDSTDWDLSTAKAYTVEAWIYLTAGSKLNPIVVNDNLSNSQPWALYIDSSNKLNFYCYDTIANTATSSTAISLNAWTHVAATLSAGTIKVFINGTQAGSATYSGTIQSLNRLVVGACYNSGLNYFSGSIDSLRITRGYVRYPTDFTPPAVAFPVGRDESIDPFWSSTVLAMHMDDLSDATGRHAVTNNGPVTNSTSTYKFGTASASFDGTSQYLTLADSPDWYLGQNDFTIEFWLYLNALTAWQTILVQEGSGNDRSIVFQINSTSNLNVNYSTDGTNWSSSITTSSVLVTQTWYHCALTRNGSNLKTFINGALSATASLSSSIYDSSSILRVGKNMGSAYFSGYLDDLRITKGVARYTQNFTPPTRAFATTAISASAGTVPSMITSGLVADLDAGDAGSLVSAAPVNLLSYSEQFGSWTGTDISISERASTGLDGSQNMSKLIEKSTTNYHFITLGVTKSAAALNYVFSVYAQAGERSILQMNASSPSGNQAFARFNLADGTIHQGATGQGTSPFTRLAAQIVAAGAGIYRCILSFTTDTDAVLNSYLYIHNGSASSYTGDGTSGLYIWGAQLEAGSTATPYVRTPATTTNLLTYSEQFDNAAWAKSGATVTANAATAPDGTSTGDKVVEGSTTAQHMTVINYTFPGSANYTLSTFAKAGERTKLALNFYNATDGNLGTTIFDLSNGTASGTGTITSIANGWYRLSITAAPSNLSTQVGLKLYNSGSSYTGDGTSGLYLWGAQLEAGSSATAYIPTTSAAASRYSSPQTWTNLLTYSEQFDNAAWSLFNGTLSANSLTAPDGTLTMDKLVEDTSANYPWVQQTVNLTAAATYTYSVYVKDAGVDIIRLLLNAFSGNSVLADFRLSTKEVYQAVNNGTGTGASGSITDLGNGYFRLSLKGQPGTTGTSFQVSVKPMRSTGGTYQGDGTSGVYIWGAQLELSSELGPYIPTTSASASFTGTRTWRNLVESPADGSSPTAYDFLMGGTRSTAAPTPYGISGGRSANDFIQFDGNDLLSTRSIPSFIQSIHKAGAKYTIEFAGRGFPLAGSGSYPCIISTLGGDSTGATRTGFEITVRPNNQNTLNITVFNAGTTVFNKTITMDHSGFWHIAFAIDAQTGTYATVANGKTTSGSMSYSSPATVDSSRTFELGRVNTNSYILAGSQLHFVRIYNRALSTAELTQNWAATRARFGV